MRRRLLLGGMIVGLVVGLGLGGLPILAQSGPYSAQIQRALAGFAAAPPAFGGPILLPNGTAAAPSLASASDPTTGWYYPGAAGTLAYSAAGSARYQLNGTYFNLGSGMGIGWKDNALITLGSTDLILVREAAATLQMGNDAAGVTNQLFKGPDRITSDGVGGDLTFAGGRNRGASAGGSIIFQTSPAAGAGVAGTLGPVLTLSPTALPLTTIVAPASSGVRFLCISTAGVVTSQAAACVGT